MSTDRAGRRCRSHRLQGEYTMCYFHWNLSHHKSEKPAATAHPLAVAMRLMPAGTHLDNADAVRCLLTSVIREMIEGSISTKQASTIAYLTQNVLLSMQHAQREAAHEPPHPMLHADPEATVDQLAQALQTFIVIPSAQQPAEAVAAQPGPSHETPPQARPHDTPPEDAPQEAAT